MGVPIEAFRFEVVRHIELLIILMGNSESIVAHDPKYGSLKSRPSVSSSAPENPASGTRTMVLKKISSSGEITVYLGRRNFGHHMTHVDPIEGIVKVDPEYLNGRKIFGEVNAMLRYVHEQFDMCGKTFIVPQQQALVQIYPPAPEVDPDDKLPLTILQQSIISESEDNAAHPFRFELPSTCPSSVYLGECL